MLELQKKLFVSDVGERFVRNEAIDESDVAFTQLVGLVIYEKLKIPLFYPDHLHVLVVVPVDVMVGVGRGIGFNIKWKIAP